MYKQIGRLQVELDWFKKNIRNDLPRWQRIAMLENGAGISISRQCELLGLCRSGMYYVPKPISSRELTVKRLIDEIYTQHPFYGSRRIAVELGRNNIAIDRKTVASYIREMGIRAIYPGPNLSKAEPGHKIYPYLLTNVEICHPNHIWSADVTYIRMRGGFMYLTAFID